MLGKMKRTIQFVVGLLIILAVLWYLTIQFASIQSKLRHVVSTDIPTIQNRLERSSTATEKMEANVQTLTETMAAWDDYNESIRDIEKRMDHLTQKINDAFMPESEGRKQNIETIKLLAQKIDQLSKQYVRFLKLAEDKIVVSIPPRWVDELPHRDGTMFAVGIGPKNSKLETAQDRAAKQARSNMAGMLHSKTLDAVRQTIESTGKPLPEGLNELSPGFKEEVNEAIDELLLDSTTESYWVDPNGHVYALVSLPLEPYVGRSKLGTLMDTLILTKQSITESLMDSTVYPGIANDASETTWDFEATSQLGNLDTEDAGGVNDEGTRQPPEHLRTTDQEAVYRFILEWKHDWESKDHETYMQHYSESFRSKGMNRKQWGAFKKGLADRYHQISLTFKDVQIRTDDRDTVVNFKQHYRSDNYSDCGMKTLRLKNEDGEWKIRLEKWESLPGNECAERFHRDM